jgi:hypothetical protein
MIFIGTLKKTILNLITVPKNILYYILKMTKLIFNLVTKIILSCTFQIQIKCHIGDVQ